jgi:hypothetical protein
LKKDRQKNASLVINLGIRLIISTTVIIIIAKMEKIKVRKKGGEKLPE